jgi:bacitracin transport system permease protein
MSVNQLILQNLKSNIKHYYLYVFALMFSVALYFAFVTLQYDPALDPAKGTIKGAAALRAASILLIAIVAIFNLYANNIFVKRRGKEIGLLQLIGMTKGRIFRVLSTENFILYFGSLVVGTFIGFSVSKLILMVLFQITAVKATATLHFSTQAFVQTFLVFGVIYVFIMMVNYLFIQRQTILSLFHVSTSTEAKVKKMSTLEITLGLIGLGLIVVGYYVSSKLFAGSLSTTTELFGGMILILVSVIIGTYLFYKGSVRLILNIARTKKNGYLNVREMLSLASIMYRMKSNALLLTVITTVSALAIGLLSLSYIAYYSAEKTANTNVPNHFAITNVQDADRFKSALDAKGINNRETTIDVIRTNVDLSQAMESEVSSLFTKEGLQPMAVISDKAAQSIDLTAGQSLLTGVNDAMLQFFHFKGNVQIQLHGLQTTIPQTIKGVEQRSYISWYFAVSNLPVLIVDESVFHQLKQDLDPTIQRESSIYIGVDIVDEKQLDQANGVYHTLGLNENFAYGSHLDEANGLKNKMGLLMFIVGFLGLTFLITSGCILYFKQMDESEDEKSSYTILRKLGFTQSDLLKGIQLKQLFNFGIPLVVGLCHSYFAIRSGWFFFGTALWTPMLIVMVLYTVLYSVFGVLSVQHYRKVIGRAL